MTERDEPVVVLCVEDDPLDRELIRDALSRKPGQFVVIEAEDRTSFLQHLERGDFHVVLTDFNILGFEGLEVVRLVNEQRPDVPVIVVTGTGSEQLAVESLQAGASDYVIKTPKHIAQLPHTIGRALEACALRRRVRQQDANFRAVLSNVSDALVVLDQDGRVLFANPAAERILGRAIDELLDKKLELLTEPGSVADRVLLPDRQEGPGVGEIRRSQTTWNGKACSMLTIRDITRRARAEAELRDNIEKLRAVMESTLDAVALVDHKGCISYWNPAAERIFGYSSQEAMGGPLAELVIPERYRPSHNQHMDLFSKSGQGRFVGHIVELTARRKDGSEFPVELSLAAFRHRGNWHALAVVRDVSQRKALEDQYRHAQKLEPLGRLAAGIAHDFNNTLSVMMGYAQLLLTKLPPSSSDHELASEILEAGRRSADLVKQLLTFSRKQPSSPRNLDLAEVIATKETMIRGLVGENIDVTLRLSQGLPQVKIDPGLFEQALFNLVVNAKDAMPSGGSLLIETDHRDIDEETAHHMGLEPGRKILVRIADTGCGMDQETQARIFDPFYTTKPAGKGTGLGLSTAYGIVTQAGGTIRVQSRPGMGTTFELVFPVVTDGAADHSDKPPHRGRLTGPRGREHVLIVEDEENLRRLAERILTRLGYRVTAAPDGPTALERAKSEGFAPDLLLTDVVMPKMSGPQLAGRLQDIQPHIRVIYMSGHAEDELLDKDDLAKAPFIQKPFTPDELAAAVRKELDR